MLLLRKQEIVGLDVVADEAYTTDSNTDYSVQLAKIKKSGAELLFLPNYYSDNALILQQASEAGLDIKFFGVDGMDGILNVENFDKSLAEGGYASDTILCNSYR